MVRSVESKKKFNCSRCGMRSLCDRVPGVCDGLKWVQGNQERGKNERRSWKDKVLGGHHLQRVVDVGRV